MFSPNIISPSLTSTTCLILSKEASFDKIKQVVDVRDGEIMFGLNMVVHKGKTIFVYKNCFTFVNYHV